MGIGIWGDGPRITQVTAKEKVNQAYKSQNVNIKNSKDSIILSEGAKDFSMITKVLKDLPDVREEKVRDLMQRMENEDYQVDDSHVAEKLMEFLQKENI